MNCKNIVSFSNAYFELPDSYTINTFHLKNIIECCEEIFFSEKKN